MPPQLRPRSITNQAGPSHAQPLLQPIADPDILLDVEREERPPTPEGQAITVPNSARASAYASQMPRTHLPPPVDTVVPVPADAVNQLVTMLNRQAESDHRFRVMEGELAELRARGIPDRNSPRRPSPRRKTYAVRPHRSPPRRNLYHKSPPRLGGGRGRQTSPDSTEDETYYPDYTSSQHTSSLASSSPRRRSRSTERHGRQRHHHQHPRLSPPRGNHHLSPPRPPVPRRKRPFIAQIDYFPVPRHLEKPPEGLKIYDGTGDPNRHVDNYDLIMQYRNVPDELKCRMFPLTLDKSASDWFRALRADSVTSWSHLCTLFLAHFAPSKSKLKSFKVLAGVRQGENESLRDYIE